MALGGEGGMMRIRTTWGLAALLAIPISTTRASANANDGKTVYEQKCKACHSIGGDSGKMANLGGKLDGVGAKHDADWLSDYIANPRSRMSDAKMPRLKLEAGELDDLVDYMKTLR
jgi:cytochrome c2